MHSQLGSRPCPFRLFRRRDAPLLPRDRPQSKWRFPLPNILVPRALLREPRPACHYGTLWRRTPSQTRTSKHRAGVMPSLRIRSANILFRLESRIQQERSLLLRGRICNLEMWRTRSGGHRIHYITERGPQQLHLPGPEEHRARKPPSRT